MAEISALFWDVGGVVLSNGWDRGSRRQAVEKFNLDEEDFQKRHKRVETALETGSATLDQYLDETVFYQQRAFSKEEFKAFIFAQSQPNADTLDLLEGLARSRKYLLATLNNEGRELNSYRIRQFGLRAYFTLFLSSCFLGVRKADPAIYRLALEITQRPGEECIFIDDRPENLEGARVLGMHTIQYQNGAQLRQELRGHGVLWGEK